jgi:hypothetical protein
VERQPLAHGRRQADQLVGELIERVAQAKAQARPGKQRPHTANGTVKAIGEGTLHAIRWLLFKGRLLKHAVGLCEGGRTL